MGSDVIKAGSMSRLELAVANLPTGNKISLPVAVLHGKKQGPCIWLSAAVHGDELNGIAVIQSVVDSIDPKKLSGTLIALPVINVFGLINHSRYLPDRRDLNRSFPGSLRGSLASQLADLFVREVMRRCDFGIDIHTGSGGRCNLPQIRADLDDKKTARLAKAFGAPATIHAQLRRGSLRAAAVDLGIRTLLYETGDAYRFDKSGIRCGINGILAVMKSLGMLEQAPENRGSKSFVAQSSTWVRSKRSGFCELAVELGEYVKSGQQIASVFTPLGKERSRMRAESDGMVIGIQRHALVNKGDAIIHIAERIKT
ncbi:MAG: succinylglutamate desuccinylase/aspartoacylase family protein [Myxococcales bacterium]|nr:MAG: succinylglutamate desuccinylase/aspartoacylase family protein [Myxococcales bacterium]